MDSFTWVDGERVIRFGSLDEGAALLEQRGFSSYALLTTERWRDRAAALAARAASVLIVPSGAVADAAATVRARVRADAVVAFGGGRVVDVAKAIAGADGLKCAAIPTTLSGAEMTGFHRLPAGVEHGALVRPELVIADPMLMASQPLEPLAASAMNGLGHAVEALYSPLSNPVATMAALRSAELFASGLRELQPNAAELALAALLAGYASGSTGFAFHHVVCQTIVRIGATSHARTNAIVLAHSVRLMVDRAPAQIGSLAGALDGGPAEPARAAELVEQLALRSGPLSLTAIGFDPKLIPAVLAAIRERPELANTPTPPSESDLRDLIAAAL